MSKERLTDYIEKQKICDYIQGWINPYGKPFDGTVYEFGLKIMDYIKNSSCDEDTEELKQYRDLEEQGLLLRLPCKVGDTIYKPNFIAGKVHEIKITVLNLYESEIGIGINGLVDNKQMFYCRPEDFGKTVFLAKSEAEEKLRELEGK